jgi:hypothetical protein
MYPGKLIKISGDYLCDFVYTIDIQLNKHYEKIKC